MKNKIIEILREHDQTFVFTDSRGNNHPFQGINPNRYDDIATRIMEQLGEETDWNKLREQYFEECCEIKAECYVPPPMDVPTSMKRVAMAPHDLFAWFKKRLSNHLKEEPKDNGWISVEDRLPEDLESVWISNGKGWTSLGCMHDYGDGWCWAESNGVIYQEGDKIVAECEADDLDVKFWMPLPDPPTVETKKD